MSQDERPWPALVASVALAAVGVAAAGYWAPWVAHKTAALTIIGQDLGEFAKFLPEVRSGALPVVRDLFYLPPLLVCLALGLLAANRLFRYSAVLRAVLLLAIAPISLALLPPVFSVPVLRSEEFRLQVVGVLACWAVIPLSFVIGRLPRRMLGVALAIIGISGVVLPLWQFVRLLPATERVYRAPILLGWGPFATTVGFLALAAVGLLVAVRARPSHIWR